MPVELKESGSAVVSPETVEAEEAGDDVEEARVHDPKNLLLDDDCHCCARVAKNWLICGRKRGRWPATCFVGPDWPCMCCTYSLILAPSGAFLATGSLDETVYVWELASPRKFAAEIKYAHKDGVTCVGWLSDAQLVSGGNDGCVCVWNREAA